MTILFCFASCNNGSTDEPSVKNPEVVATYNLNDDAIRLYDDNTFVITLKDNAGTISGTYALLTKGYRLMVNKANGDIAKSGDALKLEVTDKGISVKNSDIARYSIGDAGEQTGGNPPITSGGEQGGANSDDGYSLGDAPESNRLSEEYFDVKDCADGILLECTVPAGTWQTRVYIDGVGQLAEEIQINEKKNKGTFFYPFLDPGKEYTIRVTFLRDEDKDDDGFVIDYVNGDGTIAWFETKVKAGAKSKGFVRLKDCGDVKVESNGNFKFTKMPTFENESNFNKSGHNWIMDVALVEGVSWMHEGRKTKWGAEMEIPQDALSKTQNLYTNEFFYWKGEFSKVGFICYRPVLYYEYDGKTYKYLWNSKCLDTPDLTGEAELYTNIDVSKSEDVEKIKGTWIYKSEWDDTEYFPVNVHTVYISSLLIDSINVKKIESRTYTKLDGSAFNTDELAAEKDWSWEDVCTKSSEEAEAFESELKMDPKFLKFKKNYLTISNNGSASVYEYKVRYLDNDCILSNDKKTLVDEQEYNFDSLSQLFTNWEDSTGEVIKYYIKLFADGSTLQVTESIKHPYREESIYRTDYKRQ